MIKKDKLQTMFDNIELGLNVSDSCELAGISRATYYKWLKQDSKRAAEIKLAELRCKARNVKIIQKASIRSWQASAWWLERKHKDEFSRRSEVTGKDGKELIPVQIDGQDAKL